MLKFLGEWWQEGRISTNFTQLYMAKNLTIMANFYHSLSSCMPLTGLKKKKKHVTCKVEKKWAPFHQYKLGHPSQTAQAPWAYLFLPFSITQQTICNKSFLDRLIFWLQKEREPSSRSGHATKETFGEITFNML